jgi:hypothetical protein
MAITADRLLAGIKRRIVIPTSQALLTDEDILALADDIISSRIVPLVESVNQEFFVYKEDVPLVASQTEYSIPYRAIGRALRELKMQDSNDNVRNIALISLEDAQVYQSSSLTCGFYFLSDKIRLVPNVPSNISPDQSLQMYYRLAPSNLVTSSNAMQVASVNGDDVIVASVPSIYTTGVDIDFIQGRSGNTIYAMDKTIQNISGTTITFSSGVVPSDLRSGDYLSLVQTSPVVNFVPNELYSLIESSTAYRVCNVIGDFDGAARLQDDVSKEETNAKMIIEPRIDGEPTIIINRQGLVRGNKFAQRSWLYGQ